MPNRKRLYKQLRPRYKADCKKVRQTPSLTPFRHSPLRPKTTRRFRPWI